MEPRFAKTLLQFAVLHALILGPGLVTGADPGTAATDPALARTAVREQVGDLRGALIEMKNAVLEQPNDAQLRYRLGGAYLESGDGAAAEKELQRAIDLGHNDFQSQLLLAKAWLLQGKFREVITGTDLDTGQTPQDKAAARTLRGQARLASNETAGAQSEFEAALTELPRYAPAHLGLARLKLESNDLTGAELSLRTAAGGLGADEVEVLTLRGDLAMARRQYEDAQRAYQDALKRRPNRVLLIRDVAAAQLGLGKFHEADANLQKVLTASPKDLQALYLQALLWFEQKDYTRAAEQAELVLNQTVANAQVLRLAGGASYQLGHFQQAREYLSQYHALQPDDDAAARLLGATLIKVNEPAQAYRVIKPLVTDQSKDGALLAAVGTAAVLSGKAAEGVGYLQRALALAPDDSGLKARLAAAQVATGNRRPGLDELTRLALADPELAELAFPVAADLLAHGEFGPALVAAGRFRDTHPDQARAWTLQAVAQIGTGDLDAAQASFRKALELDPTEVDAQTGLADLQYRRGDAAGAIATLERVLASHPGHPQTLINLTGIEDASGQSEKAITRLAQALRAAPGDTALSAALAHIYVRQLRLQEALDLIAAATDPDAPQVLIARGQVELAAARNNSALATLKRLAAGHPDWIDARLLLARAYQAARDWPAAHQEIDAALGRSPNNLDARLAAVHCTMTDPGTTQEQATAVTAQVSELTKSYPKDPRVTLLSGELAARAKQPTEALALLRAAHAALQTSETAQALAGVLFIQGQREPAIALLRDWLVAHSEDTNARLGLIQLEIADRNYRGAADDLAMALGQQAEVAELKSALAWTLALAGRTDEAAPRAAAILRDSPRDVLAAHAMALVHLAREKPARAVEVLKPLMTAGIALTPLIQLDYARALLAAKDAQGARAALNRLLDSSPADAPERTEAQALLGRLPR